MKQVKEKETDTQLALDAIQYLPFPEGFEHVKSYTMSGIKYINANYLPVSGLASSRNRRSRAISSGESGGVSLSVSYSSPVGADILAGTA